MDVAPSALASAHTNPNKRGRSQSMRMVCVGMLRNSKTNVFKCAMSARILARAIARSAPLGQRSAPPKPVASNKDETLGCAHLFTHWRHP